MAGYIYKWIEGWDEMQAFCEKRFGHRASFCETIGTCDTAKIWMIYKRKAGGGFAEMYLLFMPHEKGTIYDIGELSKMSYEDIRADRNSLLRK
ncbi:MAG: hypothetical protein IIW89_05785 [Alistipes sp.]|nr:hypothetical protein [Alistipes sp.]